MSALDGLTGTSTFQAVAFWITNNQMALPRPGKTARYQKDPIAYGNRSTIQVAGEDTDPLQVDAIVKDADYPALALLNMTVGTLTLLGDVPRTALLAKVTQPKFYREGQVIVNLLFEFD